MSKTVTVRLDEEQYKLFKKFADMDNRAIANFIVTATSRYIEEISYVDEFEMTEIESNRELEQSLERGRADVKENRIRILSNSYSSKIIL